MTDQPLASQLGSLRKRLPMPKTEPGTTEPPKKRSTWADLDGLLGPIRWDWPRWLAPGFFHLLAGQTGAGKSALALRVAACYLAGWAWPDGAPFEGEPGKVLWLECESAQALNLQRAKDWSLPLEDLLCPLANPLDDLDWRKHQRAIRDAAMRPDVRLVILDSLSGANGGRVDENSQAMIALGAWLARLAQDAGKPVLATHHTRKRGLTDGDAPTLDRVRGSGTIPQLARVVWMLDAPKASAPQSLRLSVIKSNLAKLPRPIGMGFDGDGLPTFGESPAEPENRRELEEATQWLLDTLRAGPMLATDVAIAAQEGDISPRTLRRAKMALGVQSEKVAGAWQWCLR